MTKAYIGMSGDILHHNPINIIGAVRAYGDVVAILLTDAASPYCNSEQRRPAVSQGYCFSRCVGRMKVLQ